VLNSLFIGLVITERYLPLRAKLEDSLLLYVGVFRLTPESYDDLIDATEDIVEENPT
jgi:hypothetical protein